MTTMAMAPALRPATARSETRAAARPALRLVGAPVDRAGREVPRRGLSGLRLTARGRVALWFFAFVLVASAVLVTSRAAADGPQAAQQVERHVVQPGETMWQIASSIAGPGQDVRDVVLDLVRLNELPSAGLMAGQVIVVPVD
ncbi:LysM peptidoglycan-binding domain-containing protein [Cellulomonas sp. McL0617]|uniref:LysM peptidoglycan-binding domain-containing protein n=1 Tax=Cellulomonas sp. McL0617 TaxID=3415675 RepID=UPI003CE8800E